MSKLTTIADYRKDMMAKHNPAPPLDNITFRKTNILDKEIYISPKSKLVIAKKLPKKSASALKIYGQDKISEAVTCYLLEASRCKKGQSVYLLVHTDELDHEQIIDKKEI